MKVLLTRDVESLGDAGEVLEVAPGYGRNYLIPQGLAVLASPGALSQRQDYVRAQEKRRARERAEVEMLAARIEGLELRFRARVGEKDRLYGSITSGDVAQAVSAELGEAIDKRKVELEEPIKELGGHQVAVHLGPSLRPRLNVIVEAEEAETEGS